jgi:hypothetical protein
MATETRTLLTAEEIEAVRRKFPSRLLGNKETVGLLMELGLTCNKARTLLCGNGGEPPALPPVPGSSPRKWPRDLLITQYNVIVTP